MPALQRVHTQQTHTRWAAPTAAYIHIIYRNICNTQRDQTAAGRKSEIERERETSIYRDGYVDRVNVQPPWKKKILPPFDIIKCLLCLTTNTVHLNVWVYVLCVLTVHTDMTVIRLRYDRFVSNIGLLLFLSLGLWSLSGFTAIFTHR